MVLTHTIYEYQKWDAELCLFTFKMSDLTSRDVPNEHFRPFTSVYCLKASAPKLGCAILTLSVMTGPAQ